MTATALLRERITRDHVALVRGWVQGMGLPDLAQRYLAGVAGEAGEAGETAPDLPVARL